MSFLDLIERLEQTEGPSDDIDRAIADAVRWDARKQNVDHPAFTSNIDHAVSLMNEIAQSERWGVSFADGKACAVLDNQTYTEAPNAAVALCIVTFKTLLKRYQENRGT